MPQGRNRPTNDRKQVRLRIYFGFVLFVPGGDCFFVVVFPVLASKKVAFVGAEFTCWLWCSRLTNCPAEKMFSNTPPPKKKHKKTHTHTHTRLAISKTAAIEQANFQNRVVRIDGNPKNYSGRFYVTEMGTTWVFNQLSMWVITITRSDHKCYNLYTFQVGRTSNPSFPQTTLCKNSLAAISTTSENQRTAWETQVQSAALLKPKAPWKIFPALNPWVL